MGKVSLSAPTVVYQGSAQQVSYTMAGGQLTIWESPQSYGSGPVVARTSNGDFTVLWTYTDQTWTSGDGIGPPFPILGATHTYIEQFDSSGTSLGAPQEVNLTDGGANPEASIATDQNGNPVVAYFQHNAAGVITGVDVERYNPASGTFGSPTVVYQGSAQQVSYTMGGGQSLTMWESPQSYGSGPVVARASNGDFTVLWTYTDQTWTSGDGVVPPFPVLGATHTYIEQFDSSGTSLGAPQEVNLTDGGANPEASIATDQNGNPVVAYFQHNAAGVITGVDVERYNPASGTFGSPTVVYQGSAQQVSYTMGGQPLTIWESPQSYGSGPVVARASNGDFTVLWTYTDQTWTIGDGIGPPFPILGATHTYIEQFDSSGTSLGAPQEANLTDGGANPDASIATDQNGNPVVAYFQHNTAGVITGVDVESASNDPTLLQYLLFSDLAYDLTPGGFFTQTDALFADIPASVSSILDGFTVGPEIESRSGLTAVTFVDNVPGTADYMDVVIAFRGSTTNHDYRVADAELAAGIRPAEFGAAVQFVTQTVWNAYTPSAGYSYFVTGHSLGAAEAEIVAAALGFGGDTFAAPGVGNMLTTGASLDKGANLTDYNIATDTVGGHTTLSGQHVGTVVTLSSVHWTSNLYRLGVLGGLPGLLAGLQEHPIANYGQALVDDHLISAPNPLPISASLSPVFEDLDELNPNITNVASQTDGSGNVIETGNISVATSLGTATATISEELTQAGETILSINLTSGTETASEVATFTSAGLVSETIVVNGVKISSPPTDPADIDVAPDGTIVVGTSSSDPGQELTLDALIDGSFQVFSGGDSQVVSQLIGSFLTQGLASMAFTVSPQGSPGFSKIFSTTIGNHTIGGGSGGTNTVDYSSLTTSGLVAIVQGGGGVVNKGGANGNDSLSNIQDIIGSSGSDVFYVDAPEIATGNGGFDYLIELSAAVNLAYGANFTGITEFVSNVGANTINFATDTSFAYLYGSTGNDTLSLGTGGGYLFGESGSNTLNGGANATNLFEGGSGGSDAMNGGTGTASNFYYVDGNDQVNGAGAFNTVIELVSAATVQLGGAQYQHVQEFVSNTGANIVTVANADSDFVYLYGSTGNDTLSTGSGGGYLFGEGGTNVLTGGGGLNVFVAGGASGVDTMNGGSGSNVYFIDANSMVHGAGSFNTAVELRQNVSLALGSAQLGSNVQEVVLNAGTNTVDFHTATGSVFLYGGTGSDTLFGGTGNDFLYGEGGANVFRFATGWGQDTIMDWSSGTNSLIDLTGLSGLGVHAIGDLTQTIVNGSDVITSSHAGSNTITLNGLGSTLAASSFHFA